MPFDITRPLPFATTPSQRRDTRIFCKNPRLYYYQVKEAEALLWEQTLTGPDRRRLKAMHAHGTFNAICTRLLKVERLLRDSMLEAPDSPRRRSIGRLIDKGTPASELPSLDTTALRKDPIQPQHLKKKDRIQVMFLKRQGIEKYNFYFGEEPEWRREEIFMLAGIEYVPLPANPSPEQPNPATQSAPTSDTSLQSGATQDNDNALSKGSGC